MIYCVIGNDLEPLVGHAFDDDDIVRIGDGEWLVRSSASTSKAVWEHLEAGIEAVEGDQEPPTGVVLGVRGYYGYHENTIWEWLAAKRQENGD